MYVHIEQLHQYGKGNFKEKISVLKKLKGQRRLTRRKTLLTCLREVTYPQIDETISL